MKGFRRSLNKDKDQQRPAFGSNASFGTSRAPQNATISPAMASAGKLPPKGIIRAIAAYRSQGPQELSFSKGDFFHIMGERRADGSGGQDWYDAANPATGARGLVPMDCFEVMGKTSTGAAPPVTQMGSLKLNGSTTSSSNGPPSKFAISSPSNATANGKPMSMLAKGGGQSPLPGGSKSQSLYGIVQYDFEAQRADELDAKKGEHIILIAQSNHEWFVAKPIGRLGGPGLIPVSFVEVMNMATGKALDSSTVAEMVRGGALPPVDEWKKSTAEYKQASIPLGRFDFASNNSNNTNSPTVQSSTSQVPNGLGGPSREDRQPSNNRQIASQYDTAAAGNNSRQQTYGMESASQSAPALHQPKNDYQDTQRRSAQSYRDTAASGNFDRSVPDQACEEEERQEEEDYVAKYGLLAQASVESFHQEEGSFWFHMRCTFTSSYSLVLYRLYEDFYEFQIALMDSFKVEAGRQLPENARPGDKPRRILPMMPGPATQVDELVCTQRVADLTVYLSELCRLPDYIKSHPLFYDFLLIRPGDVEIYVPSSASSTNQRVKSTASAASAGIDRYNYGENDLTSPRNAEEAEHQVVEYLDRMPGASGSNKSPQADEQQHRPSSRSSSVRNHKPNSLSYSVSSSSRDNRPPSSNTPPASATTAQPPGPRIGNPSFMKIKIFHRNTDDLIAIRVPPHVTYQALLDKVRERLGSDVSKLRYREELGNAQARLVELYSDEDLASWLHGGYKLVLYAD